MGAPGIRVSWFRPGPAAANALRPLAEERLTRIPSPFLGEEWPLMINKNGGWLPATEYFYFM